MSEYLRKILGAGKTPLTKSKPIAALTADAGPDIPGGDGANEGFWRNQLRDPKTQQFIEMGGGIICTVTLPDGTVAKGTGFFKGNSSPGVAIIEFKGSDSVPDGQYNVPHENILGQADAIIPAKDLARSMDKADGVIDDPKNALPEEVKTATLKKSIEGEEALSTIKGEAALVAKEQGRFPIARGPEDIKAAAKKQYEGVFAALQKEHPDLVKDFKSFDAFWDHAEKNIAIDTSQRWADSVDEIPELTKATNRIYAREVLGLDPDGLITFYRNSINHHDNPDKAAAGYISLDQRMAWNYNSDKEQSGHDGRYAVKAAPDEVLGLLGYSKVADEYGVVVGPDVTSQPNRYERVGDLAWTPLNPLMDPKTTQMGTTGDSYFRHFRPAAHFDFPVMDSKPFEDGESWSDFYKQFNLQKGDIPKKYDELYGEGSFDRDFPDSKGVPNYANFVKYAFTEKDGKHAFNPIYLSGGEFLASNATSMEPNKGDKLDLGLKFLSTIQELSGKAFMVHRSHSKNDSRLKDAEVEKPKVEKPKVEAKVEAKPEVKEAAKEAAPAVVKDLTGFTQVSGALGSNKGGRYKDPATGAEYYVKFGEKARLENEALASDIYKLSGINATDLQIGTMDGESVIYSPWIEGTTSDIVAKMAHLDQTSADRNRTDLSIKNAVEDAQRGFAIDAWLANWDVVGTAYDNLTFDKDGKSLRVDPGGSLLYRARGELKGDAFGDEVTELDTFTEYAAHAIPGNTALELFRSMPRRSKFESAKLVHRITPEQIEKLVDARISDPETRKALKERLIARRQNIIERFSLEGLVRDKQEKTGDSYVDKVYYDDIRRSEELMAPGAKAGPRISSDAGDVSGYLDRYFDDNAPLVDVVDGNDVKEILQATLVKEIVETVNKEKGENSSNGLIFRKGLHDAYVAQHQIVYDSLKSEDADFAKQFPTFDQYITYATEKLAISDKLLVGDVNSDLASEYKKTAEHNQSWESYFGPENLALQRKINRKYAEKILKLNPDGKIRIYRNANSQVFRYDTPEAALAGYWSFDKNFAWAFNSNQCERVANESSYAGRHSALISVDDVTGIIGMMNVSDYKSFKDDTIIDEMPLSILPNQVLKGMLSDHTYHGTTRDLTIQSGATPRVIQTMSAGLTQWRDNRASTYVLFNPVPFSLEDLRSKAKEKGIDIDNVIDPTNGQPRSLEKYLTKLPDGKYQINLFGPYDDDSYSQGIYGTSQNLDFQKLMYLQKELDIPMVVNNFAKDPDAHKAEVDEFYGAVDPLVRNLEVSRIEKFITVSDPVLNPDVTLSEADLIKIKEYKDQIDRAFDISKQYTAGDNQGPANMLDKKARERSSVIDSYRQKIKEVYDLANNKNASDKEAAIAQAAEDLQNKIKSAKEGITFYEQALKDDPAAKEWVPGAIKTQEEIIAELESGYDRFSNPGHEPATYRIGDFARYSLDGYDPEGSIREKLLSGASEQDIIAELEKTPLWKERQEAFNAASSDSANEWDIVGNDNDMVLSSLKSAFAKDSRLSDEENEANREAALEEIRNGGIPVEAPVTEQVVEAPTPEPVVETPTVETPEVEAPEAETPAVEAPEVSAPEADWEEFGTNLGKGESDLLDDVLDTDYFDVSKLDDENKRLQPSEFEALTPEEVNALDQYTRAGFKSINSYLRTNKFSSIIEGVTEEGQLQDLIKNIDDAIEEHGPVEFEGRKVFRGQHLGWTYTSDNTDLAAVYDLLKPGDVLEEKAFISTSARPAIAWRGFGGASSMAGDNNAAGAVTGGSAFWIIDTPVGSKLLPLPERISKRSEEEVLLPRNSKLKIKAVRKVAQISDGEDTGDFNYFFEAEMVPSDVPEEDVATPEVEKKEPVAPTVDTFTEDEGKSLEYYSRGSDDTSTIVNTFLRMDRVFDPKALEYDTLEDNVGPGIFDVGEDVIKNEDELNYVVDNVNNAIYKYGRLENPTTLFRGISEYEPGLLENLSVGDTVSEPGFSSTSTEESLARGFAGAYDGADENHAIFQINAPKGAYGLRLGKDLYKKYPFFGESNSMNGSEVLLPSNSKFKIIEIRKEGKEAPGKYLYTVIVDLIPQEPEIVEIKKPKAKKKKKAPKNKSPFNIRLSEMEDIYEPDQDVLVYATVPKDVDDLKPGIEVSTDEDLANSLLKPDEKVLKFSVPAKDLIGIEERGEYDDLVVLYSPPEKEVEEGGGFTLKPDPEDVVPEVAEPEKPEEPEKEEPVTHTFNGKTFDFSSEEMENAYFYISKNYMGAKDVSDEEGKEFNERMQALTDYLRPGSVSNETIPEQEKLLGPGTEIKVGELRHSAPPSRFDEIMANGIRPRITDKVGTEKYSRRRFGVFLANDYTSSEAGKLGEVFRVKVPENDLRVDSGYTPYGQNLYIERTIEPQEIEHLGHIPADKNDSEIETNDFGLHNGRGTECTICNPELKALEPGAPKVEESKATPPAKLSDEEQMRQYKEKEAQNEANLSKIRTTQNVSESESQIVNGYTNANYRLINGYLRNPDDPKKQSYKKQAEDLNNVINANTLNEDTVLYRVTGNIDADFQPGDIIDDLGIQSTTKLGFNRIHSTVMDKLYPGNPLGSEAEEFLGHTRYTIKAPAGSKALDVTEMSQFRQEGEVLLPAGTKFKVISYESVPLKEPYPGRIRKITVEIVDSVEPEASKVEAPKGSDFSAIGYSKLDSIKDFLDPKNGTVLSIGDTVTNEEGKSVTVDEDFFLPNGFATYRPPAAVLRRMGSLAMPPIGQESLDPAEVAELKQEWIEKNKGRFIHSNQDMIEKLALKKAIELGYTDPVRRTLYAEGIEMSVYGYEEANNKLLTNEFLKYVYENYPEQYKNTDRYEQLKKYSEFDSKLEAYAKDVAKANVVKAVEGLDLIKVLEDGRLKNQFETGTSNGAYNPDLRLQNELKVSGTPIDTAPEKRSIFGYLATFEDENLPTDRSSKKNILHVASAYTKGYGDFKIIMKPSVKERTTFTANDSMMGSQIAQVVSPNVTPEAMKMAGFLADPYTALNFTPESVVGYYIETQIHGGISLSDIERIVYTGDQSDEILQLVKSKMDELDISIPIEGLKPDKAPKTQQDWDAKTGLETTTAKPIKGRKPGFENWNAKVKDLIRYKTKDDPNKGNTILSKFIKEAGFNGKPTILSQDDFDALEGEAIYRAVSSVEQVKHFKESDVQYAGAGSFGNGTYATNQVATTDFYAGDYGGDERVRLERTMEMKLLPDANVVSFDEANFPSDEENSAMYDYIKKLCDEFINQYRESGANPAEVQEVEWELHNNSDWTNIAIMKGIDAIRFKVPFTTQDEYYTIILNRGKVAINGEKDWFK